MEILEQVKKIVANVCETKVSKISDKTAIGDFSKWDSMGHLAIISQVEELFEIVFEPEEMLELEDINDIVTAIKIKLNK